MDTLGKQFFSGTGLSIDQDIGIRVAEIDGIRDDGVHDLAFVNDLGEMIFGGKTGTMHFFTNLTFFCLNLRSVLEGQYASGIVVLAFDGNTVDHQRNTLTVMEF